MRIDGKSTRFHERMKIEIPIDVIYNENTDKSWQESTKTEEISICGGGFRISRPIEPKRLVHLRLPMPKRFRLFDFGRENYDVWGVVRYVRLIEGYEQDRICLKVGTALVGNKPPASFLRDPNTLYDLKPVLREQSLWDLREIPRHTGPYIRSAEERREISMKVLIEPLDERGRITDAVIGETQNISESGMAAAVKFLKSTPRYVLVKTAEKNMEFLAKIRGIHSINSNEIKRLHLEFISGKWFV